jgi:LEA14-like dessication related protein
MTRLTYSIMAVLMAAVLSGCSVLGSLAAKAGFSNPTVEVTGIQVQELSLKGLTLGIYFQANNPNPIGLEVETLSYEVFFDGHLMGEGNNDRPIALPARGASSFSVTYTLGTQEALSAGISALSSKEHKVEVKAELGISTPVGVLPFSLVHTETLSF